MRRVWVLGPVLGYSVQVRNRLTGASPMQDCRDDGVRTSVTWTEAERAGTNHPGEERAHEDLADMYKYLTGGVRLFSIVFSDRARGSGHNLKHGKFHLNIKKSLFVYLFLCFSMSVVIHRKLPRPIVESLFLWIFKNKLTQLWWTCFWCPCSEEDCWTRWSPEVPSKFIHSVILWFTLSFNVPMEYLWPYCNTQKIATFFIVFT